MQIRAAGFSMSPRPYGITLPMSAVIAFVIYSAGSHSGVQMRNCVHGM